MKDKMCKKEVGKSSLVGPCELTFILRIKLKTEIYTKDWIVHFKGRSMGSGVTDFELICMVLSLTKWSDARDKASKKCIEWKCSDQTAVDKLWKIFIMSHIYELYLDDASEEAVC